MLAVAPNYFTRIAKLPWTPTLNKETPLLLGNGESTFRIGALSHRVSIKIRLHLLISILYNCLTSFLRVFPQLATYLHFFFFNLTILSVMSQLIALRTIRHPTDITLNILLFVAEFVIRDNVSAYFLIPLRKHLCALQNSSDFLVHQFGVC